MAILFPKNREYGAMPVGYCALRLLPILTGQAA